ncbi:MAG: hypothetical protein KDA84_20995, partial [Planctomycetaceae bacterium]|nr:hypothetical protein [Planctomycetaceae bacterium]
MKSLFYWFWSLLTFPPLWFVVAFALFWVGCELSIWNEDSLPKEGVAHQIKSEEKPETSIQLKIPQGWELKSLSRTGTTERFTFLPLNGTYPYLFVEIAHLDPEAHKAAHRKAQDHEHKPLFTNAEDGVNFYDAKRDMAWVVKRGHLTDIAEATAYTEAVYHLKYFYRPS